MDRKDRIAALVANPHSAVKSLKMLEAATDEELKALEDGAEATKKQGEESAKAKETLANTDTALKAAQAQNAELKTLVEDTKVFVEERKAQDASKHTELVGKLKVACAGTLTEDQLKAKTLPQLSELAALMKIDAKETRYDGIRPVPRVAAEGGGAADPYAAPDPYAKDVKVLQGAAATT